ncbi:hypothetical protein M0R45_003310 [Rubus argutus]|uniref:Uncharacterized protein n=1 Tax=Rubus argutus TaxID=59490 RepID=A0AAW1YFU0_RUBAR
MTTRGGSDQVQNPVESAKGLDRQPVARPPGMEPQARNNLEPDHPMDVVEVIVCCKNYGDHDKADCPDKSKSKDVVTKKVYLCRICRKNNGDHSTARTNQRHMYGTKDVIKSIIVTCVVRWVTWANCAPRTSMKPTLILLGHCV